MKAKTKAEAVIETKRAEGIDRALRVLDELEATLKGLRACLSSERPGFPIYINDAHQSIMALMLLTAHHNTLLDVEQKMGAK